MCLLGQGCGLHFVLCEICGWGRADRCGTAASGGCTVAGGRAVRAEDQAAGGRPAPPSEPEVGLPVAPAVAGRRDRGPGIARAERITVPSVAALPGEARRVSVQRPLFRSWRSVSSGAGLGPWRARPPA